MVTIAWLVMSVGVCLQVHGALADDDDCSIPSCVERTIDTETQTVTRVNTTSGGRPVLQFQPKYFSSQCSMQRVLETCINELTPQELDKCIAKKEQKLYLPAIRAQTKILCDKSQRLDKLVTCMNNVAFQRWFSENVMGKVEKFVNEIEKNNPISCSEVTSEIRKMVTKLSAMCDSDGVRALLEGINEFVVEMEDKIVGKLPKGVSREDVCLDEFIQVTKTAQTSLSRRAHAMQTFLSRRAPEMQTFMSRRAPDMLTSQMIRSFLGL